MGRKGGLPARADVSPLSDAPMRDLPGPTLAVLTRPDTAGLLGRLADALNACERAGLTVELDHGGALTARGYVLAAGDARLGSRWQARPRLDPGGGQPGNDGSRS